MFRAAMCPSSGELIVPIRHLVYVTLYRWPVGVFRFAPGFLQTLNILIHYREFSIFNTRTRCNSPYPAAHSFDISLFLYSASRQWTLSSYISSHYKSAELSNYRDSLHNGPQGLPVKHVFSVSYSGGRTGVKDSICGTSRDWYTFHITERVTALFGERGVKLKCWILMKLNQ